MRKIIEAAPVDNRALLTKDNLKLIKEVVDLSDKVSKETHKLLKLETALERDTMYQLGDVKRRFNEILEYLDGILKECD